MEERNGGSTDRAADGPTGGADPATRARGAVMPGGETGVRSIDDVRKLRAMADPTRLAILAALMRDVPRSLRVMSAKELAAELAEPQTKLYRHIKQLEEAGLIRVASSRLVSGITEHRYQAAQADLVLARGLVRADAAAGADLITALLARFRDGFLATWSGAGASGKPPNEGAHHISVTETRIPAARFGEFRTRLERVAQELDALTDDGPDSAPVTMLIGFYRAEPR